jgi:glycosyltransferase involved in cell wall biosynthesis/GT2 family glycosyltransferase
MQSRAPEISVITPAYEPGAFLLELAQGLRNQTLADFEWIIVDDASAKPEAGEILRQLAAADPRIRIIRHETNQGPAAARNTGIAHSSGHYLFFVDSDDLVDVTILEKSRLVLERYPSFAFVNTYVKGFGAQEYHWKGGFHDKEIFLADNRNTSCFMSRRSVFQSIPFDAEMKTGCEDWDFWLHAASKGFWGYTIPEYLYQYRRSAEKKWEAFNTPEALKQVQQTMMARYGEKLKASGFPSADFPSYSFGYVPAPFPLPQLNIQPGSERSLLCVFPWLEIGGADQFNINFLKGLKERGWTITLVTTVKSGHPWEDEFRKLTTDIFHLPALGADYDAPALLDYIIQSRQPARLFLSNSMLGYHLLPHIVKKYPSLPVIDYVHCDDPGWCNGGYPFLSAIYTAWLAKTLVTSQSLKNWCLERGADKERVSVCYINVDTKKISRSEEQRRVVRQELNLPQDLPLIIYVARLTRQKQPDVLVKTLAKLKEKGGRFKALIIGDGPDREQLLADMEKYKLGETVTYLGSRPNAEVMRYMDAADLFFLPSLYEGIALSIFEAMAKGLPIVGADVGGQSELVANGCGVLVKPSTPAQEANEYAEVLLRLTANPASLREMGLKARRRVEEGFDLEGMVGQMETELLNIPARPRPSASDEEAAYLRVLNRLTALEKQNGELWVENNSGLMNFLKRYKGPLGRLNKIYHKLRKIKNRI